MKIKLTSNWSNGVWHNIFKADNIKKFDVKENCLLDDFCDYCGYTIKQQINESKLTINGPINIFFAQPDIDLSIIQNNGQFIATYQVVGLPFIKLVVKFYEENRCLVVEDEFQNGSLITQLFYKPLADQFVKDGAEAIRSFMND
jgi:hypothetical protein